MSVPVASALKQLHTRLARSQADSLVAEGDIKDARTRLAAIRQQIDNLKAQIADLESQRVTEPIVSEHALLRYVERVLKIDLEEIRNKLLDNKMRNLITTFGSGKFPHEGYKVVVRDHTIVSIIEEEKRTSKKNRPSPYRRGGRPEVEEDWQEQLSGVDLDEADDARS